MFFLNPQLLYLAPVAAAIVVALVMINYRRKVVVQRAFGDWRLLSETSKPLSFWRYLARALLAALTVASLMVALARPIIPDGTKTIAQGTVDVVAVVDVSRSMAAMEYDGQVSPSAVAKRRLDKETTKRFDDQPGTRLEMVRDIMLNYMLKTMDGNQLGVVSFAGEAFPQAFLTRDSNALKWVIDRGLTISSAPGEGSALGKALILAEAMFAADSPDEHERVVILFSDGGNDDDPKLISQIAREFRQHNIKLVVVAMGNVMPAKIPLSKLADDDAVAQGLLESGKKWLEIDGEPVKSGLDMPLLQGLTNIAGGDLIHLQKKEDLDLMNYVGKQAMTRVPGDRELFSLFLMLSLVSFVLTFAVTGRLPKKQAQKGDES